MGLVQARRAHGTLCVCVSPEKFRTLFNAYGYNRASRCTHSLDIYTGYALPIDNPCDASDGYQAQDINGLYISNHAYEDVMIFARGVCGSPAPYTCTRIASDSKTWNCLDSNQDTLSTCILIDTIDRLWTNCVPGSGVSCSLVMRCATSFASINCH